MAKESSYDQYLADLKKREQQLREEIEKESTQLEANVKTGLFVGVLVLIGTTFYYLFFRRPSKTSQKTKKQPVSQWITRWILETVGMEVARRFWQARKAKFKDS